MKSSPERWTVPASGTAYCHKAASQKSWFLRRESVGTGVLAFQGVTASQNIRAEVRLFCEEFREKDAADSAFLKVMSKVLKRKAFSPKWCIR